MKRHAHYFSLMAAIVAVTTLFTGCPKPPSNPPQQPPAGTYRDNSGLVMSVGGQLVDTAVPLSAIRAAENRDDFNTVRAPLHARTADANGRITQYEQQGLGLTLEAVGGTDPQLLDAYVQLDAVFSECYLRERDIRLFGGEQHLEDGDGSDVRNVDVRPIVQGLVVLAALLGVAGNLDVGGDGWIGITGVCPPGPFHANWTEIVRSPCGPWWLYDDSPWGFDKSTGHHGVTMDPNALGGAITMSPDMDMIVIRYGYNAGQDQIRKTVTILLDNDNDGLPNRDEDDYVNCPGSATRTDRDDPDSDDDGVDDGEDPCPLDPTDDCSGSEGEGEGECADFDEIVGTINIVVNDTEAYADVDHHFDSLPSYQYTLPDECTEPERQFVGFCPDGDGSCRDDGGRVFTRGNIRVNLGPLMGQDDTGCLYLTVWDRQEPNQDDPSGHGHWYARLQNWDITVNGVTYPTPTDGCIYIDRSGGGEGEGEGEGEGCHEEDNASVRFVISETEQSVYFGPHGTCFTELFIGMPNENVCGITPIVWAVRADGGADLVNLLGTQPVERHSSGQFEGEAMPIVFNLRNFIPADTVALHITFGAYSCDTPNPGTADGRYWLYVPAVRMGLNDTFMDPGTALLNGQPLPQATDSQGPLGYWIVPIQTEPACDPVAITSDPQGGTITEGDRLTLSVGVNGTIPVTYQWLRNGQPFDGSTGPTLIVTQAGNYAVRVTNACNTAGETSNVATVNVTSVCNAPMITRQPQGGQIPDGDDFTLSVQATGTGPLHYNWYRGNTPVGNDSASITVSQVGNYYVIVSNECGNATDTSDVVTVSAGCVAPAIPVSGQPQGGSFAQGGFLDIFVQATGTALRYQWQLYGDDINGAMSSTLRVTTPGNYRVVVSNDCGEVTSSVAVVTQVATGNPPVITEEPADQARIVGQTATFSVTATGTEPLFYQWYRLRNGESVGQPIAGATSASYTTSALVLAESGDQFYVVVSNVHGTDQSRLARLTVEQPSEEEGKIIYDFTKVGNDLHLNIRLGNGDTIYPAGAYEGVATESQIQSVGIEIYHTNGSDPWIERQLFTFNGFPEAGTVDKWDADRRPVLRFEPVANDTAFEGYLSPEKAIVRYNGQAISRVADPNGKSAYQIDLDADF